MIKKYTKNVLRFLKGVPLERNVNKIIQEYIKSYNNNNFLVIGANDGNDNDIIKYVIEYSNGNGILIEPQPDVFEKLKGNFINRSNLMFVNGAIGKEERETEIYTLNFSQSRWATGLTTFSKEILVNHFKNGYIQKCAKKEGIYIPLDQNDYETYITSIQVDCIDILKLVEKQKIEFPKLIFIDTEGYDYEVVKLLKIDDTYPDIVFYEHMHLNQFDYQASINLFKKNEYKLFFQGRDTIAIKKSIWKNLGSSL